MDPSPAQFPDIQDYTILRRIGGGSYGEVFLARTVTGQYRALKVVSRKDFDHEKTFEREFDGIKRYEQVSRDHAGLVDILHVGRDTDQDFYYYVMELADDETGASIDEVDPAGYTPRTLATDLAQHRTRSVEECIELGRCMAEALVHLHLSGLIHRDVKPSNIIFVNGKPKLADIGLVARSGQRTFVGTEGYVPPEGPGTSAADLYSLAMVLYEMHTGKDRLDFPELPTHHDLPPTVNRDEWRSLNRVICRGGSPDPRKRFDSGLAFANALRKIRPQEYDEQSATWYAKLLHSPHLKLYIAGGIVGLLAVVLGLKQLLPDKSGPDGPPIPEEDLVGLVKVEDPLEMVSPFVMDPVEDPELEKGATKEEESPTVVATPVEPVPTRPIKFQTEPPGASVTVNGEVLGQTPLDFLDIETGDVEILFRKADYHEKIITKTIEPGDPMTVSAELKVDLGPRPGENWENSLQMTFVSYPDGTFAGPVGKYAWEAFHLSTKQPLALTTSSGIIQETSTAKKWAFCDWMTRIDREIGYLSENEFYAPVYPPEGESSKAFYCRIEREFGTLIINSEPPDASIYRDGQLIGKTPDTLRLRKGPYQLVLRYRGFEDAVVEGTLVAGDPQGKSILLKTLVNSQQMPLVPVGNLLVAAYETKAGDYKQFLNVVAKGKPYPPHIAAQPDDHPVTGVSRKDAEFFCRWLTYSEKIQKKRIRSSQVYRLPTDLEWSEMAGLPTESGASPKDRENSFPEHYSWGGAWPPPANSGNFADLSAKELFGDRIIDEYNDSNPKTSRVGSFAPSTTGLYDLSGNVWEWVSDSYLGVPDDRLGVVRGGGFDSYEEKQLSSSYRLALPVTERGQSYGFRYVLADEDSE